MRKLYNQEKSIFCQWSNHKFSYELQLISEILDQNVEFLEWVAFDLKAGNKGKNNGAKGMSAEQVLRAAILKQQNGWSYEFFEWQCVDSTATRAFLRFDSEEKYSKSALQENISKIRGETWIRINESLVRYARDKGLESGRTIRVDATAIESNMHAPTDSSLLFDCFKISDRVFKKIRKKTRIAYYSPLTTKLAKSYLLKIQYANGNEERLEPYKILIKEAKNLSKVVNKVSERFKNSGKVDISPLKNITNLLPHIIDQAEKRVIKGQIIPPEEKVVSIFEAHTDIIMKGKRDVAYGHKVFLTAGKSGIVTDCQLVQGNPSDKEYFLDLISKQKQVFGKVPRQVTADGGFASEDNVYDAKEMGVKDVCFSKPVGLGIEEMVKSPWVFQKLRNFRAGIEGIISTLKRGFGLSKVLWKGVSGFASYVHSSIVSYNLTKIAVLCR